MAIIAAFMVPHPPVVIPEIGGEDTAKISSTFEAYKAVGEQIQKLAPDTIVLSSPHAQAYSDYFQFSDGEIATGSFSSFGAGQVRFRELYDKEMVEKISSLAASIGFPAGSEGDQEKNLDHGTMVPLYFINHYYRSYKLVRLGLSGLPLLSHYKMGQIIAKASNLLNRRVVFIGSGDLSHCQKDDGPYGYRAEGPRYDELLMKAMGKGNFGELFNFDPSLLENAEECGHRSFVIMAGTLDRLAIEPHALAHEATFGVGYGVCSYLVTGPDPTRAFGDLYESKTILKMKEKREHGDPLVKLAYASIDDWILRHKRHDISPFFLSEELKQSAGAFVSIHEFSSLRGCIGTILPQEKNLAEEIISNAISASSRDPRFSPISENELPFLEVSVDVLSTPEKILSKNSLDPSKYGVIVSKGGRRGLLLPNLPGVNSVDEQIRIAKKKAGIELEEEVTLERFTSTRHQ
jgi:AmmeMemoRadiSam system protein A/AmmeMemoRadiSam system protein B